MENRSILDMRVAPSDHSGLQIEASVRTYLLTAANGGDVPEHSNTPEKPAAPE
ncbi:hypothetical protein GCM10010191_21610 [Actinomadura vinacea]|uniref:Uncharacterized protein n=1 Tax=Actinomadura vinacea TaxID=115336 RepID=A0ABP5VX53_9ACTN